MITAKTQICMVIGDPIAHSLSPQLHNAGYKALGIEDKFVYVAANVKVEKIKDFVSGVRSMGIRGVACTIPHKTLVIEHLDSVDNIAQKIGAVNTIVNEDGKLIGYNTDWLGFLKPVEKRTTLEGKTVVLLGAGGAARAVAYAVNERKGKLKVFNRTLEKAQEIVKEFGGDAFGFDFLEDVKDADIIVNATSVGLHPRETETPLPKEYIRKDQVIFDLVYPGKTRLLKEAHEKGAIVIEGVEMLLYQGLEQFRLHTGYAAPEEDMKKILL